MIVRQPSCNDINELGLMPVNRALQNILDKLHVIEGTQRIALTQARCRILAEDLIANMHIPPLDNSAVDGFAFKFEETDDNKRRLMINGTALAGQNQSHNIQPGQCLRIMTGAYLPENVDTVVMQEHVLEDGGFIHFAEALKPGQNVRYAGEDISPGQLLLKKGRQLQSADIGLLASLGYTEVTVKRKLRVALASTGDELLDIGDINDGQHIYDSNRYSLMAILNRADIETIDLGILPDQQDVLLQHFSEAAKNADLVLSTGGVSVGAADFTKAALQQSGNIEFWKVAVKPGRPLAFGSIDNSIFFGLPGNPVAVFVTFFLFVLPALEKMLGIENAPIRPTIQARSLQALRKKPGRTEIQRGNLQQNEKGEWQVSLSGKQGSGILTSISNANAFIILPHDADRISAGDWVTVQPLDGLF